MELQNKFQALSKQLGECEGRENEEKAKNVKNSEIIEELKGVIKEKEAELKRMKKDFMRETNIKLQFIGKLDENERIIQRLESEKHDLKKTKKN